MKIASTNSVPLRVLYTEPTATAQLARQLSGYLEELHPDRRIAVVCLGTDRSTGDSLGPLTGFSLSKYHSLSFDLFGTLEEPVHAMNLDDTLERLHHKIRYPFIIGIDACLGKAASVGCIQVGEGPIRPGAGVNKQLSPVGDIYISGVVNIGGFMEYYVLQNTRLHVVMRMADLISRSLYRAISTSLKGHRDGTGKKLMYTQISK